MAITRAQQVKQMLRDGGVTEDISFSIVKPSKDGKRPGYFSGLYGGGAGDRGGDPRGSREENERANRTDSGNVQRAENYRRQQSQTNIPKPKPKPKPTTTFNGKKYVVGSVELKNAIKEKEKFDRIQKQKKELSQKGLDSTNIFGNIKKKIADYNKNYKTKQLARYQKAKIDELNSKLGKLGVDFYGDTEETYGDIITANAPSITEFGPEGKTPKYSQQFIDDVLSGKRKPPESFQEIGFAGIPGAIANMIGPKMSGPITKEELMDIYSGGINSYVGARDFDIDDSTGREMMEIFEPNRFKREFGDNTGSGDGGAGITSGTPTPSLIPVEETVDNRSELEKLLDARGAAYRFFADGGRVPAMAGGIMNTDVIGGAADGNIDEMGRQMYFVGKLVKKATRAVKKIVKSPLGKAALIGAAGFGIPGTTFGGLFGRASLGGAAKGLFGKYGIAQTLGMKGLSPGALGGKTPGFSGFLQRALGFAKDNPLAVVGGLSALPFLFPGQEEEEEQQYEGPSIDIPGIRRDPYRAMGETYRFYAEGGKAEPVAKKTMPLIDMDGKEMDLRDEGGFVPLGRMERADDVPARLSKNEFVFTADAVRNAGEGDIDKGAEVMYNMMKNLESGGEVSEESQGLDGAREMFKTSQRLEEVL
jgi:hypothetical protein